MDLYYMWKTPVSGQQCESRQQQDQAPVDAESPARQGEA
jgi:hypothetical protein